PFFGSGSCCCRVFASPLPGIRRFHRILRTRRRRIWMCAVCRRAQDAPLEKCPRQRLVRVCLGQKGVFLWLRFLDIHQRNELETLLISAPLIACQRSTSKAFAFGDFISFDWRQKKRSKEKRLVPRAHPAR